jgi:hypothetical protein
VFDLRVLREAELKHGRFAMLAVLGFIVQEVYTFPFFPKLAPVDAHDYFVTQVIFLESHFFPMQFCSPSRVFFLLLVSSSFMSFLVCIPMNSGNTDP